MLKRLLVLLLVSIFLFGCGGGGTSAQAEQQTEVTDKGKGNGKPRPNKHSSPVVSEPVVSEPVVSEPVVSEPVVSEPVVSEPVVSEPVVSEPVVTADPLPLPVAPSSSVRKVGYYAGWTIYTRNYAVGDIAAQRLTHINYAFANISTGGEVVLGDPWGDVQMHYPGDTGSEPFQGAFNQLLKLKAQHPHLKTLISIGGWSWSSRFSDVALTNDSRAHFARSAVEFITRYGFDGIDIDWEYPVGGGQAGNVNRPEDKHNFTLLMSELRRQLDARGALDGRRYLLTAAIGAGADKIANLEVAQLAQQLDWFNVMSYDFHGAWESLTNHHAALLPSSQDPSSLRLSYNVQGAVDVLTRAGAPAQQIVVGVPFYGRGWQGAGASNGGLYQGASTTPPAGTGQSGSSGSGIYDYWDIQRLIGEAGYVRRWDSEAQVPSIYLNGHFISYEDAQSIALKADFVKQRGLGGMMIWELSNDARSGTTLLEVMHQHLQ